MAGKDPAVLFYTSDFLGGVALMTMKERGQYITLLCLQRDRGHMTRKEMEKAVGKLSEEVWSKFVEDEDGRLYNERMEREIQKRKAYSKRQRENVEKRWKKRNGVVGNNEGNTMVLPSINGNGNNVISPSSCSSLSSGDLSTPSVIPPPSSAAAALADYLDRVNPSASQTSLDELRGYAETMGAAVCKRAIDIALDAKKASWPYIRAILRDKQSQGVRCLADWDALEARREADKHGSAPNSGADHEQTFHGWRAKSALDDAD